CLASSRSRYCVGDRHSSAANAKVPGTDPERRVRCQALPRIAMDIACSDESCARFGEMPGTSSTAGGSFEAPSFRRGNAV
ncbi:MAG: hypothetical protein ACJ8GJ_05550, partial [Vitreoscilla sp.]